MTYAFGQDSQNTSYVDYFDGPLEDGLTSSSKGWHVIFKSKKIPLSFSHMKDALFFHQGLVEGWITWIDAASPRG